MSVASRRKAVLEAALHYASLGIPIFQCYALENADAPGTYRKPPKKGLSWESATTDPEVIKQWWKDDPDGLIGMPTGEPSNFDVLDLDVKHGVNGHKTIPQWETLSHVIASTPGFGDEDGHHVYFVHDPGVKLENWAGQMDVGDVKVETPGVDVRTTGGYVILPPSYLPNGREYKWHKGGPRQFTGVTSMAPGVILAHLMNQLKDKDKPKKPRKKRESTNHTEEAAQEWLRKSVERVEQAQQGQRDNTLNNELYICGSFVREGLLDRKYCEDQYYAAALKIGLDDKVIREKLDRGINDGIAKATLPYNLDAEDEDLSDMNALHAVLLNEGGKFRVLSWTDSYTHPGHQEPMLQTTQDFLLTYMNKKKRYVNEEGETKTVSMAKWWLSHPGRRQYDSLRLMPGEPEEVGKFLNLWRGLGVSPAKGDWSLMREHIRSVLASGNIEHDEYMLRWAAWAVQNPATPPEVALVLQGGRGTGKSLFGRTMLKLFGAHGSQIMSPHHLVGHFNSLLQGCCFLFADEAFFAGDKRGESVLKGLITEPLISIERKGLDVVKTPNMLHILMASNDDWVIPAGEDERRFAMFKVSSDKQGDHDYFGAIMAQLDAGGYAAMLYDLINMDLGDWHPRKDVPQTAALQQQKDFSRDEFAWTEMLEGYLSNYPNGFMPGEALWVLLGVPVERQNGKLTRLRAAAMAKLGWVKTRRTWAKHTIVGFQHTDAELTKIERLYVHRKNPHEVEVTTDEQPSWLSPDPGLGEDVPY